MLLFLEFSNISLKDSIVMDLKEEKESFKSLNINQKWNKGKNAQEISKKNLNFPRWSQCALWILA